jgi:pimeloyl-ACP methyl ester carboxylesterase
LINVYSSTRASVSESVTTKSKSATRSIIARSRGEWDDYSFEELQQELPWLTREEFEALRSSFALSWYREHFQHDPLETIRGVPVPVLILQGEKDVQVPPEDAHQLARALEEAGNTAVVLNVFADLDHLLRWHPERASLGYTHLDEPLDGRPLQAIADFIYNAREGSAAAYSYARMGM